MVLFDIGFGDQGRPPAPTELYGAGRRLLVAEDDDEMRSLLACTLRHDGFQIIEARNGVELVDQLTAWLGGQEPLPVDLILTDIQMPYCTGMDVLAGLSAIRGCPPVVLITAFGDPRTHDAAAALGAAAVLDKPFDIDELRVVLCRILHDRVH